MITLNKGPVATYRRPRTALALLDTARGILHKAKGSAEITSSYPPLPEFEADVDALEAAQADCKDGSAAAMADRSGKVRKVVWQIDRYVLHVQGRADTKPGVEAAATMILDSGLEVRKPRKVKKSELSVKHGVPTEVELVALALRNAGAYYWEMSADDQQSWTLASETTNSRTTITGLTPGRRYHFRFRMLTNKGKTEYSQIASIIAH